jgi:hypothetical protein
MKIPKISVTFGEKTKPELGELGATGTTFFYGLMTSEEYNADLKGTAGINIFDKMRRSDGSVKAALLACELPLRAATWSVEPASDSPKDKEIAEFVERNLKTGMTIPFDEFLRHVLMMLAFGFSIFEKVFEVRDGQYCWRKLAPRLPKSLYSWKLDDEGGLAGIIQQVQKGTAFDEIHIPVEKMIVFVNDKEGSNYQGTSLLRAAYKHWYFKENLYRIDGLAAEKNGLGTPVFDVPANISKESEAQVDKMGKGFHAHERMYFKMPEGYDMRILGLTGSVRDIMPSIEHHDKMILRSILAQFLSLGSGDTGSWALSQDQSSFFLMALKSVSNNVCDTMNRHAIKQLVDFNYQVKEYPTLTCSNLETRQTEKLAVAIQQLVSCNVITPDPGLEDAVRQLMKLPEKEEPEEETKKVPNETAPDATPVDKAKDAVGEAAANIAVGEKLNGIQIQASVAVIKDFIYGQIPYSVAVELLVAVGIDRPQVEKMMKQAKGFTPDALPEDTKFTEKRDLKDAEKLVAFTDIDKRLDDAIAEFVKAAQVVQKKQIDKLAEVASKIVSKGQLDKVDDIDVPYRAEMAAAIQGVLEMLCEYGRENVRKEMTAQLKSRKHIDPISPTDLEWIKEFLASRSKATASVMAVKLKSAVTWEALRQMKANIVDPAELLAKMTELSDKELQASAQFSVSEAFNFGRGAEAELFKESIDRAIYSAILDKNTCVSCQAYDGKEYQMDDPQVATFASGNPGCYGGGMCRCMLVYVAKSESK